MNSNSSKTQNYLTTTSVILLLSLVCYGVFFYLVSINEKQMLALEKDLLVLRKNETRATSERSVLNSTEKDRALLYKYFIDPNNIVVFIEKLESLASISDSRISLSSVDIDKNKKNLLKLNFSVNGSFEQVFHFLALLESLPFEINIKSFNLTKSEESIPNQIGKGDTGGWTGNFSIELLSFINPIKK